ncbi:hypothetical protein [Streptomyces flaveus]|nr:hypothetical protein [Streptomyces flaveus]
MGEPALRRPQGPRATAVLEGGRRLRPILTTALATIFAVLPLALGITGGGGFIAEPWPEPASV